MINPRQQPPVVWGFPNHYNPNLMGEVCERCRASNWLPRLIPGQDFTAWTCTACTLPPSQTEIPD